MGTAPDLLPAHHQRRNLGEINLALRSDHLNARQLCAPLPLNNVLGLHIQAANGQRGTLLNQRDDLFDHRLAREGRRCLHGACGGG